MADSPALARPEAHSSALCCTLQRLLCQPHHPPPHPMKDGVKGGAGRSGRQSPACPGWGSRGPNPLAGLVPLPPGLDFPPPHQPSGWQSGRITKRLLVTCPLLPALWSQGALGLELEMSHGKAGVSKNCRLRPRPSEAAFRASLSLSPGWAWHSERCVGNVRERVCSTCGTKLGRFPGWDLHGGVPEGAGTWVPSPQHSREGTGEVALETRCACPSATASG